MKNLHDIIRNMPPSTCGLCGGENVKMLLNIEKARFELVCMTCRDLISLDPSIMVERLTQEIFYALHSLKDHFGQVVLTKNSIQLTHLDTSKTFIITVREQET